MAKQLSQKERGWRESIKRGNRRERKNLRTSVSAVETEGSWCSATRRPAPKLITCPAWTSPRDRSVRLHRQSECICLCYVNSLLLLLTNYMAASKLHIKRVWTKWVKTRLSERRESVYPQESRCTWWLITKFAVEMEMESFTASSIKGEMGFGCLFL